MAIYLGDFDVQQLYLGDLDPSAAYVGDTQIYPSSVVITGLSITSTVNANYNGGTFNIRVKSESDWVLSVSDSSWITVSPVSGTSGSVVVAVTLPANDTGADRDGYITATTTDNAYSAVCSIHQVYFVPYIERYFTVISLADNNTCTFNIPSYVTSAIATSISYSTDDGANWTTVNVTSSNQNVTVSGLSNGDKVLWKGIAKKWASYFSRTRNSQFNCSGQFALEGNIMSLLSGDTFYPATQPEGNEYFCSMFYSKTNLVDAENLILTIPTPNYDSYREMFSGCTNLVKGPQILCDSLASTSLYQMFQNCVKLNYVVCTASGGLDSSIATANWMSGVASSGTFVKSPNATVGSTQTATQWGRGASGIPNNWTVVDYGS